MAFNDEPFSTEEQTVSENKKLSLKLNELSQLVNEKTETNGLIIQNETPTQEQILTNKIFNSLGSKIIEISQDCLKHKEENYLKVSKVLINLVESIVKIGNQTIFFTEDNEKTQASGGKVTYFKSNSFYLDNAETILAIQIRPEDEYAMSKGIQVLKAQARTSITLSSNALPDGEANIRIDPPDVRLGNNVVFDLSVGRADKWHKTLIDKLSLGHLGQNAGHHFSSGIRIQDFKGAKVSDIHRTVSTRLGELSK